MALFLGRGGRRGSQIPKFNREIQADGVGRIGVGVQIHHELIRFKKFAKCN